MMMMARRLGLGISHHLADLCAVSGMSCLHANSRDRRPDPVEDQERRQGQAK